MIYGRFQQKIDTSANWAKAANFIPLEGELIIYQDYDSNNKPLAPKYKNGDGKTKVNDLPFEGVLVKGSAGNSAVLAGSYEGYKNEAISQVSMALGAATTAGLKGWYYTKVNLNQKMIWLSNERSKGTLGLSIKVDTTTSTTPDSTSFSSGWNVGDKVTIVNGSKYEQCAEIKAVNGNLITLDKLPFDSNSIVKSAVAIGNYVEPDEFSITAIKITDNSTTKARTVTSYDKGAIDFGGGSHAEGVQSYALNIGTHAEGIQTVAYGQYAHTEGFRTEAGYAGHAEGGETKATGTYSHAEGRQTTASGYISHTEGSETNATNDYTHAEGYRTTASGVASHAEGHNVQATAEGSHAEGIGSQATGPRSHAEGSGTEASGTAAHAEGIDTDAFGVYSHAEGQSTVANGIAAHAEGATTQAINNYAHAEGYGSVASGSRAHAEGNNTVASGNFSHAGGNGTVASGESQTVIGKYNIAVDNSALIIGNGENNESRSNAIEVTWTGHLYTKGGITTDGPIYGKNIYSNTQKVATEIYADENFSKKYITAGQRSDMLVGENSTAEGIYVHAGGYCAHAEGHETGALAAYTHSEGNASVAHSEGAHAEGKGTQACGDYSHTEGGGSKTTDLALYAHAEGQSTQAQGEASHAEGCNTFAVGKYSHSEGYNTQAIGARSHAEGQETYAYGNFSHAEGYNSNALINAIAAHAEGDNTNASGYASHTEGQRTKASGTGSHAEGSYTEASGAEGSHAEGSSTKALGIAAHAEGCLTEARAAFSHASGNCTIADREAQTVVGQFNKINSDTAYFIVGAGSPEFGRANAFEAGTDSTGHYISIGETTLTETELKNIKDNQGGGTSDNIPAMQFIEGGQLTLPPDVTQIYSLGNKLVGFTESESHVYVSTDLGQTWQDNTSTLPDGLIDTTQLSILSVEGKLFVSSNRQDNCRLFVTDDAISWTELDISSAISLNIECLHGAAYYNGLWYLDLYYGVYCLVNNNNQVVATDHVPIYSASVLSLTGTREGVLACCQYDHSSSYYRFYNITTKEIIETNVIRQSDSIHLKNVDSIIVMSDYNGQIYTSQDDGHTFTEASSEWGDIQCVYNNIYCGYSEYSEDGGASWKDIPEEFRCHKITCQDTLIGLKVRRNPTTNTYEYYLLKGDHPAKMSTTAPARVVQDSQDITSKLKQLFASDDGANDDTGTNDYIKIGETKITESQLKRLLDLLDTIEY